MWMHFKPEEFDSPDLPGSGERMNPVFVAKLDVLRELCGFPFKINSGFRTEEHNASLKGSKPDSEHTRGRGVDIHAPTSTMQFAIVTKAPLVGFNRIGVGRTFVHVGDDPSMPQNVLWHY